MKILIALMFILMSPGAFAQSDQATESNSYDVLCVVNLVVDMSKVSNAFYGNGLNEAEACNLAISRCYAEIDSWGPQTGPVITECRVIEVIDNSANK
jgi:hypothetical protein